MKKTWFIALVAFVSSFSSMSFAAEFSVADLLAATKVAMDDFTAQNPTHADHFTGYKVWKSGEEAKAKVYVTHNGMNMDFNYLCHKHDSKLECHAQ